MASRRPGARFNRGRTAAVQGVAGGGGGVTQLWTLVSSVTCLRAWQSDFQTTLSPALLASGTTPPAVTLSGSPSGGTITLRVEITLLGALGVAQFRYSADGGSTFIQSNVVTAASVVLTGAATGITLAFPAGTYAADNVYVGTCSSWTDQKNLVPALQATGANQPLLVANALGTHPAIRFDGVNDVLRDATLDLPPPATTPTFIWMVATQRTWTINTIFVASGTTAGTVDIAARSATPSVGMYNAAVVNINTGMAVGTPTRIEASFTGSTSDYLHLGTTTVAGASAGNTDSIPGWNMGATSTGGSAGAIDIYTCLIFNGVPSGAELSALSSAAAAMYPGLAV